MKDIKLNKQQSQTIAKEICGDIKDYCLDNFERYFPWLIDEMRKEKGKPPLKAIHIYKGRVS